MANTNEHDLGVAIMLLLAQGIGHVEIYIAGESDQAMFGVETMLPNGDPCDGLGPTATEAAENAVRHLPAIT